MKFEFSAGGIVFRRATNQIEYLLLEFPSLGKGTRYWGFPKGLIEEGESAERAARREIGEETGLLEVTPLLGFKEKETYVFKREGDLVRKTATFFLVEVPAGAAPKISEEHTGWRWFSLEAALGALSFGSAKEILQKADKFLRDSVTQTALL